MDKDGKVVGVSLSYSYTEALDGENTVSYEFTEVDTISDTAEEIKAPADADSYQSM